MTYRMLGRLGAVLALAATVCLTSVPASAQFDLQRIDAYDIDVTVERSGRLHVVETIDYVFGSPLHGIERWLPVRARWDDVYDRVYPLSGIRVSGSQGTPTQTKVRNEGPYRVIRIGDPDRTIEGRHRYVITYDVDGAINRFEGHDELYWNVVGAEWEVPIRAVSARVRAQEAFSAQNCFAGPVGSKLGCRGAASKGSEATFEHGALRPKQAMTVVLALPPGYAAKAGPVLEERWSIDKAFSRERLPLGTAVAVLLAGLGVVLRLVRRKGRDLQYAGQIPGLEPPAGVDAQTRPVPAFGDRAGPVEWSPGDMPPGLMGLVLDEEVHTLDVTATIVDLAVRGWLTIEELPRRGWFAKRNWRLTRLDAPEGDTLAPWESTTLRGVFDTTKDVVELDDLKNKFHPTLVTVKGQIYDEAVRRGWFTRRPDSVRGTWSALAGTLVVAGGAATYALARWTHYGLAGVALVLVALVLLANHKRMPFRTAKGSAALARALGFRRYLATAEADQLRAEEKANVFARYLPYAVVLGETERWAKVFKDLGLPPQQHMGWYSGPDGWSVDDFGSSLSAFSSSASSTITSTPGSSGSSGFGGGGSSGGGGGGGGGGGW